MTDRFLNAIRAAPDDDLPRLIFADWLDERGDPHGALVRLQLELARLDFDDPRLKTLAARESELLHRHEDEWLGSLGDELLNWHFHRGLVEVTLDIRRFLNQPNPWLDQPTVGGVHLYAPPHMEPELLNELTVAPRAERVRSLNLGFEWLRDRSVEVLANSERLCHLAALDLNTNGISDEGAMHLGAAHHLPALRYLSLRNNLIGDSGAVAVTKRPALRHIDLSNNEITKTGARAISNVATLDFITRLTLNGNNFDGRCRGGKELKRRLGERVGWR